MAAVQAEAAPVAKGQTGPRRTRLQVQEEEVVQFDRIELEVLLSCLKKVKEIQS